MQNSSNPLNAVSAALVLSMAPIILLLGIVGSVAETGQMRVVFLVMTAGGLAMLIGGIQMLVKWRRAVVHETAHQQAIRATVGPRPATLASQPARRTLPSGEPVLAHWVYQPGEWSSYAGGEVNRRTGEWIGVGVAVLIVGLVSSTGGGQEGWTMLASAVFVAVVIVAGGLLMTRHAHRSNVSGPGEAIITPSAILINGRYHVLSNDTYRLEGVRFDEAAHPPQLDFTVAWSTRSGPARDHLRVPVPAGREAEARQVAAGFKSR